MLRFLFHRHKADEPCPHMVKLLHGTAGGQVKGFARWYALAHAAKCGPCRRFLESLEQMLLKLREGNEQPTDDAIARMMQGPWREE
ncbi:MAG: hypothetical protein JNM04_04520 [Chthonomonas sp.]|nr:hypothetical protein [Chthonomonas sp.]